MWHHICVTWRSTNGAWQFYLDGQLQSNGTGLKENHQIPADGTVVIGQDQDTVGGGFQTADSFGPLFFSAQISGWVVQRPKFLPDYMELLT